MYLSSFESITRQPSIGGATRFSFNNRVYVLHSPASFGAYCRQITGNFSLSEEQADQLFHSDREKMYVSLHVVRWLYRNRHASTKHVSVIHYALDEERIAHHSWDEQSSSSEDKQSTIQS